MKVKVILFAYIREDIGFKEREIEIKEATKVGELWNEFKNQLPRKNNLRVLFAVNEKYVNEDEELKEGDEVAFIPPVSGG